jgi:hypothetical protein
MKHSSKLIDIGDVCVKWGCILANHFLNLKSIGMDFAFLSTSYAKAQKFSLDKLAVTHQCGLSV